MATYNYYTNPYQTYYPPYQMPYSNFQPAQPTQPQYPTQPTQQSSILWVSSENEAAMYPVAPNNAVTLWNQHEPVVYLKQADASGKPTMKTYDLVERPERPQNASNASGGKVADYATKDDLAAVVGAVNGLDGALTSFKGEIETIKGDLYGIAGKKKPSKKSTEAEDE